MYSLLSVSLEMFVMQYCNNVIFELDRTQAWGWEDNDFLGERRTVVVWRVDHGSVFHVHETAFQNVPYLLVGKTF